MRRARGLSRWVATLALALALALVVARAARADGDAGVSDAAVVARTAALPAREPSAREVVAMALRAARGIGTERVRELTRRARLAGLAPQLRLSAERGVQQDRSASSSAASDRTQAASGADLSLSATLTFELDRLVFAAEEVRLLSIDRWLEADRRRLMSEVVRLYFQRRRLLREQASAPVEDPELGDAVRETEALLDALTDGAFGVALRDASR